METRKTFETAATKAATPRAFRFRLSDGCVDREGDTIVASGWDLRAFRRSPVVLWAHDHKIPAIAKATEIGVEGGALVATIVFPPAGLHGLADTIHDLVDNGFLATTSVGFRALEWEPRSGGGVTFLRQELLEASIVNVPANANALLEGRSRSVDAPALTKWLGSATRADADGEPVLELLDDGDDLLDVDPQALAQAIVEVVRGEMRGFARAEAQRAIGRARGRVSDVESGDPAAERLRRRFEARVDLVAFDERELAAALREIVPSLVRATLAEEVARGLRRARGRLD